LVSREPAGQFLVTPLGARAFDSAVAKVCGAASLAATPARAGADGSFSRDPVGAVTFRNNGTVASVSTPHTTNGEAMPM